MKPEADKMGPIKRWAVDVMQSAPMIFNPLWKVYYPLLGRSPYEAPPRDGDRLQRFRQIYNDNGWRSDETRSGPGSTLAYTAPLRKNLPALLKEFGVSTLLDAPCGDFHWMRTVRLDGIEYIGADIVPELIAEVAESYSNDRRTFKVLDVIEDPLPAADVWLCRDALFHFPEADILTVLSKVASSEISYFLSSTYRFVRENKDVESVGFRCINLELPPYNLPPPLRYVEDFVVPFPPRHLGLWSRSQIAQAVAGRLTRSELLDDRQSQAASKSRTAA